MPEKPPDKENPEKQENKTDERGAAGEDQKPRSYYYDDACGYEIYIPEEDETGSDEHFPESSETLLDER